MCCVFRFLQSNKLCGNDTTRCLLDNMERLETCDPAVYHSVLSEAVNSYKAHLLTLHNNVKQATVQVLQHSGTYQLQLDDL